MQLSGGYLAQQILNGLIVGSFYSLLAVAYALVHAITNRVILSFGDFMTFGAFYAIVAVLVAAGLGVFDTGALVLAFLVAVFGTAALGIAAHRLAFASLIGAGSQALMIVSVGVGIIVSETLRIQSGGREQWLPPVFQDRAATADIGGFTVQITVMQIVVLALALVLSAGLLIGLERSAAGRTWRAVSEDRRLAELCGVDTARAIALTVATSSAFAGVAGFIVAVYYGGVSFYMGLVLGLKALFATVIGGSGTIGGAILGGFVLAGFETAWSTFLSIGYREVAVFAAVVLIFLLKPEGLLGVPLRSDHDR